MIARHKSRTARMTRVKRFQRVLEIVRLLHERAYTTSELAQKFGVSQRTIERDIAELQTDPTYAPVEEHSIWRREYRIHNVGG